MAGIFKRPNVAAPNINGLRVTKSLYGDVIGVIYGRTRSPVQLIWANNFKKNKTGKKGKGGVQYTMDADMMFGFGPLQGIGATWVNTQYFQGTLSFQDFTTGTGTTFTFTITGFPGTADLTIVIGVVATLPYTVSYSDYGGPASGFSGNSDTPLPNQLYPAPNSGDWANSGLPYAQYNNTIGDPSVTVVFPASVSTVPVRVYFMYGVRKIGGKQTYVGNLPFEKVLGTGNEMAPLPYNDYSGVGAQNLDLGSTGVMPNISFEVVGLFSYGKDGNANPADIIADIICSGNNLTVPAWPGTHPPPVWQHGLNFTSLVAPNHTGGPAFAGPYNPAYTRYGGILDDEPNLWGGTYGGGNNPGLNLVRNFCQAYNILLSYRLDAQQPGAQLLTTILEMISTAACWDGAQLKLIPYCEVSQFGSGASYVSPTSTGPLLTFTDDDYIKKDKKGNPVPPVVGKRSRPNQDYNSLSINFTDRLLGAAIPGQNGGNYNRNNVVITDKADVMVQGPMPGTTKDYPWIHDKTTATNAGWAVMRRNLLTGRLKYEWSASARFGLLSLMDLVLLTEPTFPSSPFPVRITRIKENPDYTIEFEAEPFFYGACAPVPASVTAAGGQGTPVVNQNIDPGSVNAPIIFEAVPAISDRPQIWICTSGSAVNNYGGCDIWLSTDGGATYNIVGKVYDNQTQGKVYSANYPSHADPDNVNTLHVDLTQSHTILSSFTAAQRDNFDSLCFLDPGGTVNANGQTLTIPYELIAYTSANLTAVSKYDCLPTIRRGVYGTPIAAHNIGQNFSFLKDGEVFKLDIQSTWIGVTLHFKFTAFNPFGLNEEAVSAVTDYPFTPTGLVGWSFSGGGTPPGSQPFPTGGVNPSVPANLANDFYTYVPGVYDSSQELARITPDRNVTLPINLTASVASCDVAPTANVSVGLNKVVAGVPTVIGSVNYASGSTTGTFTFAAAVSFNGTGDVLTEVAPASPDPTFAGASITLWATRSN